MQPGAKINRVYYCENILEQGLLPAIHCISNYDFVFQCDGAPCTPFTPHSHLPYLCSNVPEFTEPENWPPNSPDLNPAFIEPENWPPNSPDLNLPYLCSNVPEFIEPENWPPNSPDLNPAHYSVCRA